MKSAVILKNIRCLHFFPLMETPSFEEFAQRQNWWGIAEEFHCHVLISIIDVYCCLLRRLRFPLPFSRHMCRCGRRVDSFGHHRASCTRTGALGRRGFALESAAARVIWICISQKPQTIADWKWSRMGCPFSVGPSWPWTRRWYVLYIAMVRRTQEQPTRTEWCTNEPGGARNEGTQSRWAKDVGRASLFWLSRYEGGGHLSCKLLSSSSPSLRLESNHSFCRKGLNTEAVGCFPHMCSGKGGLGLDVRARGRWAHLPGMGGRDGPPTHGAGVLSE